MLWEKGKIGCIAIVLGDCIDDAQRMEKWLEAPDEEVKVGAHETVNLHLFSPLVCTYEVGQALQREKVSVLVKWKTRKASEARQAGVAMSCTAAGASEALAACLEVPAAGVATSASPSAGSALGRAPCGWKAQKATPETLSPVFASSAWSAHRDLPVIIVRKAYKELLSVSATGLPPADSVVMQTMDGAWAARTLRREMKLVRQREAVIMKMETVEAEGAVTVWCSHALASSGDVFSSDDPDTQNKI